MSKYGGEYDPGYENYIDSLHADIQEVMFERDQLKAENERFVIKLNVERLVRQNVERENAKLRELVRTMQFVLYATERVTSWRFVGDGVTLDSVYFTDKLRELGVTVDA